MRYIVAASMACVAFGVVYFLSHKWDGGVGAAIALGLCTFLTWYPKEPDGHGSPWRSNRLSDIVAGGVMTFGGLYSLFSRNLAGLAIAAVAAGWLVCAYFWRMRTRHRHP